ncbi:YlxQ family RNA-binding protein [Bacillus solimangrovi]|uniref:50S ribosomal protein L7 n=1 Tax=Bacillus solimangrovi TaxID=1305675 RepID=A0A1E5LE46_9BACI|nr:YlxQ family RNA-binding protein [Bacillus solimangrovi]OEH92319.1 50S ribosomal protein L7 [Bacillus solimangrovi]
MKQPKWMSLLGLANRARQCISGEELVVKEIRSGRAKLVLLSGDASDNTTKKIRNKSTSYHVPMRIVQDRFELGKAIGKPHRVTVAVLDDGFAKKLLTLLDE